LLFKKALSFTVQGRLGFIDTEHLSNKACVEPVERKKGYACKALNQQAEYEQYGKYPFH
jgi:hypothetical protein